MLPLKERLTRAGLFQRAYSARKSVGTPFFTLYVLPRQDKSRGMVALRNGQRTDQRDDQKNDQKDGSTKISLEQAVVSPDVVKMQPTLLPLVGFVVAKKVSKSACLRNRIKRRLREAYRLLRTSNLGARQELGQWYAMVFVLQSKAFDATWVELCDSLRESIVRVGQKHGAGDTRVSK